MVFGQEETEWKIDRDVLTAQLLGGRMRNICKETWMIEFTGFAGFFRSSALCEVSMLRSLIAESTRNKFQNSFDSVVEMQEFISSTNCAAS